MQGPIFPSFIQIMGNSSRKRRELDSYQRVAQPAPVVQAPPIQQMASQPPLQYAYPTPFFPPVNQFQTFNGGSFPPPTAAFPSIGFGAAPVCPPRTTPFTFAPPPPSFPQFAAPQLQLPPPPVFQQASYIPAPQAQYFNQFQTAQPIPQYQQQPILAPRSCAQVAPNQTAYQNTFYQQTPFNQTYNLYQQPLPPQAPPPRPQPPVVNYSNCNQGIQHPPLKLPPLPKGIVSNQCSGIVQQGPPPQLSLPDGYQLVGVQELPTKIKTHQIENVRKHSIHF